ncbi:MAG: 50S ribosomal protein L25 [Ignavibacteriales bacterium]|nr:50S ribosomal protein L25 [Ignavibacteriales bacterium]
MEKVIIEAQKRNKIDKASRSALRKEGKVPAIFYSKHHEPIPVQVSERAIHPLVFTSKTHLITLNVEGHDELDCIIKDVQFDPTTEKIVHIDLLGLKKGEKIEIEVPVQLIGSAIGIKEGGILQHTLHKVQISCLPVDIPEHLEIDVTNLKLGQAIHISDLSYDNLTILNNPESIIASVTHPKVEKEATAADGTAAATAEPEVITKGKTEKED